MMTKAKLAGEYIYKTFNYADHVSKLAQNAQADMDAGRPSEALAWLEQAKRESVDLIASYLDDAIRATKEAAAE